VPRFDDVTVGRVDAGRAGRGRLSSVTSASDPDQSVRLNLPASTRFVSSARVVAASMGAEVGLDVDDLDDLRLGVDELVTTLVEGADRAARVNIEFVTGPNSVTVRGVLEGSARAAEPDELTRRILDAVADHYELGDTSFMLTKASATA
jgi:serine/threonine-protein kinase RsbW